MARLSFPSDFVWGAATASYQIEGAANEEGRGESIWDRFCHTPGKVLNGETGDIACDHYHRYREDVRIMAEIGLTGYRFSIAWPRIFPDGRGKANRKGLDFYESLVDELLTRGIEPAVTLYHWDLPQKLQDKGGWGNRDCTDYFAEYAMTVFKKLGDRVKTWITHNEPWVTAFLGHAKGVHAPGLTDFGLAVQVSHHLLLSHAKAIQAYRQSGRATGKIGISLNLHPVHPATESEADRAAARVADGYQNRWFLDPVFRGAYPKDLLDLYSQNGNAPRMGKGDEELLAGQSSDFLGINYYFRLLVKASPDVPILGYEEITPKAPEFTEMGWEVYPVGLYELLVRIKNEYGDPRMLITENGGAYRDAPTPEGKIEDDDRISYVHRHLKEAHRAIRDGVKLGGYYLWSLMDNFEWALGYSRLLGLVAVDPRTQDRTWKKSAAWYRDVIAAGGVEND